MKVDERYSASDHHTKISCAQFFSFGESISSRLYVFFIGSIKKQINDSRLAWTKSKAALKKLDIFSMMLPSNLMKFQGI